MINYNSKLTVKLLGYFFLNRSTRISVGELARVVGEDKGNVSRQLGKLFSEGLLLYEPIGTQKHLYLNTNYPLLKETEKIYKSTYGFEAELVKKLKSLKGLKEAYLFGSYGKKKFDQNSDIDLLLVGSHSALESSRLITPMQKTFGREINMISYTETEFEKKKKNGDKFVLQAIGEGCIRLM